MQKLEKIGQVVWVSMGEPVCEIAGMFCKFSLSYSDGGCAYRTVWSYATAEGAEKGRDASGKYIEAVGSNSHHTWDDWGRLKIIRGTFGSPNYVAAIVEITGAFDTQYVRSEYYPYRYVTRYSNGRIGIRLVEICEANQTAAGAILNMICNT